MGPGQADRSAGRRRIRAALLPVAVFSIVAGWILVPAWFELASSRLEVVWIATPEEARLRVALLYVDAVLLGYAIAAAGSVLLIVVGLAMGPLSRAEARVRRRRQVRLLAPGAIVLLSLVALDVGAAFWEARQRRPPDPWRATRWPVSGPSEGLSEGPLRLAVLGESSARGEPYFPWLSAGQIAAWGLESVFPGRPIRVEIRARGGAMIRQLGEQLEGLKERPGALIVCVGHNEFASRFPWMREPGNYYDDEMPVLYAPEAVTRMLRRSPACRLALSAWDNQRIGVRPPRFPTRELVDRPVYTDDEYAAILREFGDRLEAIVDDCERAGTLPILIVPASNDPGFDPSRSVLAPSTPRAEREAFARDVRQARELENSDPDAALRLDHELCHRHPEFAEVHYRIGRLLERRGDWDEARTHYLAARERDGMPMRMREDFRRAYRDVAARHPSAVLVDSPAVLERADPHGLPGDRFFHDAQHPNLRGYLAIARDLLAQLRDRRAFGWPEGAEPPPIDVDACARHSGLDRDRWAEVCRREALFFDSVAYIRPYPAFRLARAEEYRRALAAIQSGHDPAGAGVPGWPIDAPAPASSSGSPQSAVVFP